MTDFTAVYNAPERNLIPWNFLTTAAHRKAEFSIGHRAIGYQGLLEHSSRLAHGLSKRGFGKGDRIASILPDCCEVIEILHATMCLGAIYVPLSPYLKGQFLAHQLVDAEPAVLVVDLDGLAAVTPLIQQLPEQPIILLVGDDSHHQKIDQFSDLYDQVALPDEQLVRDGCLPAAILYTSGTTGMPKGCVLSQGNLVKVGAVMCDHWGVTPADSLMSAFPLFHSAGLIGSTMTALVGGISYHNVAGFRASIFMADAASRNATIAMAPGAVGEALLAQPVRETDRSNRLRLFTIVPFSLASEKAFIDRYAAPVWVESYGQTECMVIAISRLDGDRNPSSIGRPTSLVEVSVLDDCDNPVPVGDPGEIALRPKTSGAMFQEYWRKPDATIQTWAGLWHHTGDYGYLDAEGFLHFLDRKKDALRRRGENVSSAELEAAIIVHPKIRMAAVHAIPSEFTEDDIKACLILEDDVTVTPSELFNFFCNELPYFAIPRYIEILTDFPMTDSMKVRKDALRARGVASAWDFEALGLRVAKEMRRQATS